MNTTGTNTWTGDIVLNSQQSGSSTTLGVAAGGLTILGSLSGSNGLVKVGTGALTLSAGNSFTGSAGGVGLAVESGTLTLTAANAYAGATAIGNNSGLTLSGLGAATETSGITVSPGGTLKFDDSTVNVSNRFGAANTPDLTLNSASFTITGSKTPGTVVTDTFGNINLLSGNSTITVGSGTGLNATVSLTGAALVRSQGATVNFVAQNTALGSATNQIVFNDNPTLTDQILPYAVTTAVGSTAPTDFVTYDGFTGVQAFTNYAPLLEPPGRTISSSSPPATR